MANILIALPNDTLGGAEQFLRMIAGYYLNRGYHVHVFFLKQRKTGDWEIWDSERLHLYYTTSHSERYGSLKMLKNIFGKRKLYFEYIYTSHVHCTSLIGFLVKVRLLKCNYFIARESTSVFMRFKGIMLLTLKILYRLGYGSVDLLICQTDFMKRQLLEGVPWLERKMRVETIPNPVDMSDIANRALANPEDELPEDYIVSAGRLIEVKGYDILIKAFRELLNIYPGLNLVILGEGKERKALENLVSELGMEGKVHLYGFRQNVFPYLRNARLCVVSSRIEGFPNILLQMMSQNTKVVSTLCAGGIEDIEGLYTCSPNDLLGLFRAMENCLGQNDVDARELFDRELDKRSLSTFVNKVETYVRQT